jgi:hypothetical protein
MRLKSGHKLLNRSGDPEERAKHVVLVNRRRLQPILLEISGKFILIVVTLGCDVGRAEVGDGFKPAPSFFQTGLVDAWKSSLPETRVAFFIFAIRFTEYINGLIQARADFRMMFVDRKYQTD